VSRRGSSRRASVARIPSTRLGEARPADRRRRWPRNEPRPWPPATATRACRRIGKDRVRRRPAGGARASRSSRSPGLRPRPRPSRGSSAGRTAIPRRRRRSSRLTCSSTGCEDAHRSGIGCGST
jgi:hypothetical protein